ncbi:hypothetical protein Y032_0006g2834 [Ancylostoma ceylanicum]|nr:hypothetical protein Y032_0006g2834 [Ancylostoma ceylanicum]
MVMKACVLLAIFFSSMTAHAVKNRAYHPTPDLSESPPFLPRAILYYCYKFPLRDDGSLVAFSERETNRGERIISPEELAKVLYPRKKFSEVEELMSRHVAVLDTPFWRDAPLHHMMDVNADLDGAAAAWIAEPAFTRTQYVGKQEGGSDFYGTIIKQIYEPFGFPFEVPCYSNHVEQIGMTTVFYKLPKRNFVSVPSQYILDPEEKIDVTTFLSDAVRNMAMLTKSKTTAAVAMPQLIGRDTGTFTHDGLENFLLRPEGKLMISPYMDTLTAVSRADIQPWASLTCAALIDNEPRSLGVIINVDYLVNDRRPFKYSDIKVLDIEAKKPVEQREPLPILDESTNLKIDISWDDWSCCSACCCSGILCGKFYTPERKCVLLPSIKVRKGYLSLMKIDMEKPVLPWNSKGINAEFQRMMSISPYKERGIALWSTIWETMESMRDAKEYKEKLYERRFEDILNDTKPQMAGHPGFYIDEIPCNEEKYDCAKLAECRGINIKSKIDEELEGEADPCAEYEPEIETIFIDRQHSDIELFPGRSYRIRIREEVFATDATRISWRVSSRPPGRYDTSRACLEQGIVHLKSGDLLLTSLTSRDVKRRLEATLSDGRRINVQLHNARRVSPSVLHVIHSLHKASKQLGLGDDSEKVITWAVVITVFLILLFAFVKITSNRRRARMQQILLNRMKKRMRAEGKLQ